MAAISAGLPVADPFLWRDADDVDRSLTHAQLFALGGAMLVETEIVYTKSWLLKDALTAITSATYFRSFNVSSDEHWF